MEKGLISIIIPVYNQRKSLSLALYSLDKQIYKNKEIIVVDDGSNEPIEFEQTQTRKLIRQDNAGAAAARNAGFKEARGEYVFFYDADVLAKPQMLKHMHATLEVKKKASYAYCNYYLGRKKMPAQAFDPSVLAQRNFISTMSLIRSKDFVGFDESLNRFQDWDLWLSLYERGKHGIWINEYLFTAMPQRKGISAWLPKWAYSPPFCSLPGFRGKVEAYKEAQRIIQQKHGLR
ncbi:glycosyltransferase family 2 protein [Candidatus Nomurabacteria bacterium]|nr:glycosyltransferase family 2 protein [Candidatus Nomurabacteria bacterium]